MENTLFSFVDSSVVSEIKNRIGAVNTYTPSSIEYTHGRIAYAIVKGESLTLGTNADNDKLYNKNTNYISHAVLNNVNITNEGQFGSLRKASFSYTIFDKNQIDKYEKDFMIPGKPIEIFYGWSNRKHDNTNNGKFKGLIYNFSFDLNSDGSFNCECEVVGEGYFISGLNLSSDMNKSSELKDEKNSDFVVNNIFSLIEYDTKVALKGSSINKYYPEYNLAKFSILKQGENSAKSSNEQVWYIELEGIIKRINDRLLPDKAVKIKIDATGFYDSHIRSANPSEIIFPDKFMGKYSDSVIFSVDSNFKISDTPIPFSNPDKYSTVNMGKVFISIDYIKQLITGNEEIQLKSFLGEIFQSILSNSGGYYSLFLSTDLDESGTEFLIIKEQNYLSTPPDIDFSSKVLTFEPYTKNSIVKSYSLSCQLPDKMATAMYLGNSSNLNEKVKDIFLGNEIASEQSEVKNEEVDYNALNSNLNSKDFVTVFKNLEENAAVNKKTYEMMKMVDDIDKAAKLVSVNSSDITQIQSLRTALETYINKNEESQIAVSILLPLNMSISLEGINGFKFGNIISSNYLPTKYLKHKNKIAFFITKISDSIENGMWTTDIETQCNLFDK